MDKLGMSTNYRGEPAWANPTLMNCMAENYEYVCMYVRCKYAGNVVLGRVVSEHATTATNMW